ncbi:ABC transporter ATP-binding protein [Candidatus Dojkabacteria bacterium]|uniref:ABC transporter ATP-binding protein n=1 Tax=Candidatus Dojkabacteria bacterium TaxID=2099670 RepID=A0A955L8N2_9BACT|nr:ABC transporter ATP-binding protein [Candidatus Dojkabacteria bacterium]
MLISLKNIHKSYTIGSGSYLALKGVNLQIEKSEFVAIMGPSGSGKSTMLHILGCLDTPSEGTYHLNGKNVGTLNDNELSTIRNSQIGFVFQSFNLLPKFSVLDNTMLPFLYSDVPKNERKKRAVESLEKVGLGSKLDNKPNQLSGGQIQRVAIARSLVMKPNIILADEPTGNLDTKTGDEVMDIFSRIHSEEKATIIVITHEPEIAEYTDRTIMLKDGLIVNDTKSA